ncbi:MAG: tRNA (N6-isopentenyl adenosine(37)-C2)-methylthiotransferase MiaB [Candidatus Cloacimonetes bacterium]|nr:tRNA (N6-isopentenyl adenosine(37)-C2)-methylthiotransferase MiaB [Candidatus Cloacimonadota bacterium]
MRENTACIMNFGCQMNEYESLTVTKMLDKAGYELISSVDQAELVIFNTCTVRDNADEKIWNRLSSLVPQKRKNKSKKIGIMGCMVEAQREVFLQKHPEIDFLISPVELPQISKVLRDLTARSYEEYSTYELMLDEKAKFPFRTYMPIQTGCNFNCSYCIVPAVKGREVNISPDEIFEKLDSLVSKGVKEITLLGQTINSYTYEDIKFADLLEMTAQRYEGVWIRFLTSHPILFDERIIDVVAKYDNLCSYFHIPSQSGNSRILKAMKRGYTREKYLGLIAKMREIEDVCISTDMICGFPSETEEEFEDSLSMMREIGYETAFMFYYSERKDTPAGKMEDSIPVSVRKDRLARMIDQQLSMQGEVYKKFIGKTYKVLVENNARKGENTLKARNAGNLPVIFEGDKSLIGTFVNVRIDSVTSHTLLGSLQG